MALVICQVIAYIQIMSAGFNLWGVDPRILFSTPFGRNTAFVGLFILVQILGLAGAVLMLQKTRIGFLLSMVHHALLLPALVVTSAGLVMMMDDRVNVTLLFMSKPTGADIGVFWSLGWTSVFDQVARNNVPVGATYYGMNLFAFACAFTMWAGMDEMFPARSARAMQVRKRPKPAQGKRMLALPPPTPSAPKPPGGKPAGPRPQGRGPSQQSPRPANQPRRIGPQEGTRQAPPPRMPYR